MADDRYGGYGESRDWGQDRGRAQRSGRQDQGPYGGQWGEGRSFGEGDYGGDRMRLGQAHRNYSADYGRDWNRGSGGSDQRYGQAYTPDTNRRYGDHQGQQHDRDWMDRAGDRARSWMGDDERQGGPSGGMFGQHRGKGPKGWKRSSERIREDVCERLADDDHLDASEIEVNVQDNEVTLSGTVNSREDKRRAEMLVEQCSGVDHVQNNLRVQQASQGFGQAMGGQGLATAGGQGALGAGQNEAVARVTEGRNS